jgi:hypothetical protein
VEQEPATIAWFEIRLGPSDFGIFDAFPDDAGRQAHLAGRVADALMAQAPELFEQPPVIEPVDVIAASFLRSAISLSSQYVTDRPADRAGGGTRSLPVGSANGQIPPTRRCVRTPLRSVRSPASWTSRGYAS